MVTVTGTVCPVEMLELERKVGKAKALLILDRPFYGMAVSKRPIIFTDTVPTAAMSAVGQMYLNPAWCGKLTVRQLMFLLAHEGMHFMLGHSLRMGARKSTAWNVACDKVINDLLTHDKVGDPIEGGVYMDGARQFAAEQLYDEDDEGEDGNGPPDDPRGIGNDVGPPEAGDGTPLDEATRANIEAQTKIELIQNAKAAKAIGKLPGSIEKIVDDLVNVSTPWDVILEPYMANKVPDGHSWKRPNRRFIAQGLYLPGSDNKPTMGPVVLAVDASGSVGDVETAEYNGHINRIMETCNPESMTVIYCDTYVQAVEEYTVEDLPIKIKVPGGGGTSFKPVFDYIDDNDIDPEVVIYLTDGYGDQDDFTSTHETIWLTTHNENFSWGKVIKFESKV